MLGVRALQTNLIAKFSSGAERGGADMFLIDIQQDQVDGVRSLVEERLGNTGDRIRLVPVLRASVSAVRGRDINLGAAGGGPRAGRAGPRVHHHLPRSPRGQRIHHRRTVLGRRQRAPARRPSEVSIEESIHDRFGINVGDEMRFDVLGRVRSAHG